MNDLGNREFHEAANLFPLLEGAAFEELVADIRQNGLREPILVDAEGRILDGRNRYRACQAAGVEPRFTSWEAEGPVVELVMSRNLHRRHLNESQRALVAARLAKLVEAEAVKRRGRRTDLGANLPLIPCGRSRDQAAGTVNVSPRLVTHALRVVNRGCAELVQAVESGRMSVSKASRLVGLPAAEQVWAVAGGSPPRTVRRKPSGSTEPWPFGVAETDAPPDAAIAFLWVASGGLAEAVDALRDRGFHYTPQAAR